jgi:hypothetical protein
MEHIIKEAVETELHPNNMNREEGSSLSNHGSLSCQPLKNKGRPSPRKRDLLYID